MPSVLIVTNAYTPSQAIGGRRIENMAGELSALGWHTTVLSPAPLFMPPPRDNTLSEPVGVHRIETIGYLPQNMIGHAFPHRPERIISATNPQTRPKTSRSLRSTLAGWSRHLIPQFPDPGIGWMPFALRAVRGRRFDLVLASLPAPSTAIIGNRISRLTRSKLVLDYRDPWTELLPVLGLERTTIERNQAAENECLRSAHLALAASPTLREHLVRRTSTPVMLHLTGVRPLPGTLRDEKPGNSIVYAGSLAYDRSLEPLIAAMARYLLRSPTSRLRLTYIGPHPGLASSITAKYQLQNRLDLHGPLPHRQTLLHLRKATACVVVISSGYEYTYPGKLFEIMQVRRPTVLIGPPGSDASAFIAGHNLGWCHAPDDLAGLVNTLDSLDHVSPPDINVPYDLTTKSVSTRLANRLIEISGRADHPM